jgi:uncharacterized membrane protein YeiH
MSLETLSHCLAIAATIAFAVTAVLAVADHGVDIFGVMVLGVITAVGGGTIRDLILSVPVFWSKEPEFIWIALAASLIAFFGRSIFTQPQVFASMLYIDAIGAAMFGIQAALKTWNLNFGLPVGPVMLGILTAIGGGLIRDVLAGRKTLLMTPEIYAIPVAIGCALFTVLLNIAPDYSVQAALACTVIIFSMRAAAIHWRLKVPSNLITHSKANNNPSE